MKVVYPPSGAFRVEVERAVDAYFDDRALSRHASRAMHLKTVILFSWLISSYVGLVFVATAPWQAVLLAISLGCAMAGVGFNVQHDGGHRAYARGRTLNRIMGFSLDLLGGSSYFWNYKHNIAHHTYPNISGADDDIYIGPLGRLSPHDRRYWFHTFQHVYMWILYALLAIKWQLFDDFRYIVKPGIASTKVPRPPPGEHLLFWLGKVIFFGLAVVIPLLYHSPWHVLALFAVSSAVLGLILGSVFQLAHCLAEADFACVPATGTMNRDWATYQVESTANFDEKSRLVTWFVGGLNFQIEHHLFPQVCHVHYPALSAIVKAVCHRHAVRYSSNRTIASALASHHRWLRALGRGDVLDAPKPNPEVALTAGC